MRKLALLAAAGLVLSAVQFSFAPAEAKSLKSMLDSAENKLSGRSAYYNQFRYGGYPYSGYFGYFPGPGYNQPYGYANPYRLHHTYHGYRRNYNPWH
jgi:hypothetical protein